MRASLWPGRCFMVDVIMPALGMAQDTGKLLQWLKQPGDPVAVGDQLFEVETDKS